MAGGEVTYRDAVVDGPPVLSIYIRNPCDKMGGDPCKTREKYVIPCAGMMNKPER